MDVRTAPHASPPPRQGFRARQDLPHHDDDRIAVAIEVRRALATLSPKQRAAVVLRYYEDLSVVDIAAELGCAEGTAKRHLANARAKLALKLTIDEESVR